MNRDAIVKGVQKYFKISELACRHVIEVRGEATWGMFRDDYLETILFLREKFNTPMYCNVTGAWERGARCNMCDITKGYTKDKKPYVSGHVLWCAGDFTFKGYTAEEARTYISSLVDELPHYIRLEDEVNWVHIDTLAYSRRGKITLFTV